MAKNASKKQLQERVRAARERHYEKLESTAARLVPACGVAFDDDIYRGETPLTEYFLHEVAHWLTLDINNWKDFTKLPDRLSDVVGTEIDKFTEYVQRQLELDALYVEYIAGVHLEMWDNKKLVVDAGSNSLTGMSLSSITRALNSRQYEFCPGMPKQNQLTYVGVALSDWFKERMKETANELR